jgi:uncharacterized protein (TIGR04255 family)
MPRPERPPELPDFDAPPIIEVALGIQFATPQHFKSAHVGLFWQQIRSTYPMVSEQPPAPTVFETFGMPPGSGLGVQLRTFLTPPMPRYWFVKDEQDSYVLQLQQERIIGNWRQQREDQIYPRYEHVRERFKAEVDVFAKFLLAEDIGELRPNQCELTYVNIIDSPSGNHHSLQDITTLWKSEVMDAATDLESATISARYIMNEGDSQIGRIYVSVEPAFRQSDLRPVYKLDITACGKPGADTIEAAFELLDRQRCAAVKKFADVTTSEMHKRWGRR